MRVVHVITKADVGGAQTHVVELASAQLESGDDVSIIAGRGGAALDQAHARGIDVEVLPLISASMIRAPRWGAVSALSAAIDQRRPDIVHGHSSHAGLLARLAARRLRVPSVYTAHGWPFRRGAGFAQRLTSALGEAVGGRLGGAVICLTEAERERALRWHIVPRESIWVIPNGLPDVSPEHRRRGGSANPLRLVMVARFARPKRQLDVIAALAQHVGQPWHLTFVGDGPDLGKTTREGQARLGAQVAFLGASDEVPALLANFDVHVLWSEYEGLPISVLEAMRAGLCCVANDLPGTRAMSGEPPAVLIVDSIAALGRLVEELIEQPDEIDRMGAAARARFESAYSMQAMLQATRAVYGALTGAGR